MVQDRRDRGAEQRAENSDELNMPPRKPLPIDTAEPTILARISPNSSGSS